MAKTTPERPQHIDDVLRPLSPDEYNRYQAPSPAEVRKTLAEGREERRSGGYVPHGPKINGKQFYRQSIVRQ